MANKSFNRSGTRITFSIAALLSLFSVTVYSAEWYVDPDAKLELRFDDNRTMLPVPRNDTIGTVAKAHAKAGRRGGNWDTYVTPEIALYRYAGLEGLDTNEWEVESGANYATETQRWSAAVSFRKDSTLTTQNDETELLQTSDPKYQFSIAPAWSMVFDERTTLSVNASHQYTSYDSAAVGVNYYFRSIGSSIAHQYNNKLKLTGSIVGTQLKTPLAARVIESLYGQAGFEYDYSDTLRGSFSIGKTTSESIVNTPFFQARARGYGTIGSARIEKDFKHSKASIEFQRSESPSGFGVLRTQDTAEVKYSHRFTKRLSAAGNYRTIDRLTVGGTTQNVDSLTRAGAVLTWRLDDDLTLRSAYQFRKNEIFRGGVLRNAEGNLLMFSVLYEPDSLKISR